MKWRFIVITMLFYIGVVLCRRKTSAAERAFENREGLDWARPDDDDKSEQQLFQAFNLPESDTTSDYSLKARYQARKQLALEGDAKSTTNSMSSDLTASTLDGSSASTDTVTPLMQTSETSFEAKETNSTSIKPSSTTSTTAEPHTDETATDDLITALLGSFDILNLTQKVEEEFESSLDDALNSSVSNNNAILPLSRAEFSHDKYLSSFDVELLKIPGSSRDIIKTVLWIDASYKAEDFKLNVSALPECQAWRKYWSINGTEEDRATNTSAEETSSMESELKDAELIDNKKRLKKIGLNEELLEAFKAVGLLYKEICREQGRVLWYRDTNDAKKIGMTESSLICEPFKEELTPDAEKLALLSKKLNELVQNFTLGIIPSSAPPPDEQSTTSDDMTVITTAKDDTLEDTTAFYHGQEHRTTVNGWNPVIPSMKHDPYKEESMRRTHDLQGLQDDDSADTAFLLVENADHKVAEVGNWRVHGVHPIIEPVRQYFKTSTPEYEGNHLGYYNKDFDYRTTQHGVRIPRMKRSEPSEEEEKKKNEQIDDDDDEWLFNVKPSTDSPDVDTVLDGKDNSVNASASKWVKIELTEEDQPVLLILSQEAIDGLQLKVPPDALQRFEKVGLYLPGICADYVPKAIDEFDSSNFEGIEIEGPIGLNMTALEAAGVNLTALAEKLRNDTEVDDILSRTNASIKTLGGSFILPVLNKNQYDPFSAPIVFQGSAVVVRFGIYIESMSNFQTSTMDYDMDIYLLMAWRDARLVNPYDKPILVKEEDILEKIWRPDPFFANAKEAEFHEVTFLNFLMRIFPDGLVLYETRVKIKPSCNLILCKYPHDKQTCDLLIKSFAYPVETVRFEWFTRRVDAIDKNPDVKLPELYIDRYEPTLCKKNRKSGAFSCLRAVFRLKRDVGFHIAQTYIPTSLALMFSWVGVWLPEEFMEGRIGVAITVLLTLSTESAGAREHLPSVSYLKAIDLWFGFITGFVFFTLLQTLFVIGFDKRANQLRKWAMKQKLDVTEEVRELMLLKAERYHKTGRYLDNFCRVFYPLSFLLFLIMYYFVFTEGRQDDCINRRMR